MADCSGVFVDFAWRRAINCSGTDIRASQEQPVLVSGFQYTVTTDGGQKEIWFVITNVFDLRSLPGFAVGEAPTGVDDPNLQIPYHSGGSEKFEMESGPCEEES